MIQLDNEKEYFILKDNQGAEFGQDMILEGQEEVFDVFEQWADNDNINISDFRFSDLIEVWTIDILKYKNGIFEELSEEELNYTNHE